MDYEESLNNPEWFIHQWNGRYPERKPWELPTPPTYTPWKGGCGESFLDGIAAVALFTFWVAIIGGLGYLLIKGCSAMGYERTIEPQKQEERIEEKTKNSNPSSLSRMLIEGIEHYQREISPELHQRKGVERICKYEPSCSEYAKQAIQQKGAVLGSVDTVKRLTMCNRFSQGSYDPVKLNKTQEHFRTLEKITQEEGWKAMFKYDWERTKEDFRTVGRYLSSK